MQTIQIYSQNATYQALEALKTNRNKRHKSRRFLVEGVRSLNEAVENGWQILSLLYTEQPRSDWANNMLATVSTQTNYCLAPPLMAALSGKADTSELMAVIAMRADETAQLPLSKLPFLVLFDRPSNKGNLGTLIRSCDALGADGLILTGHAVDLYDPEVVTAAMGSFFRLPVIRIAETETLFSYVAQLKERYPDLVTVGTTAHKQLPIDSVDCTVPLLLLLGNETVGLSHAYKERCDILTSIPMAEQAYASSLNVSCAATVLLYEVQRQRRQIGFEV